MQESRLKLNKNAMSRARTIGDLPSADCCLTALKIATVRISERTGLISHSAIKSSLPVYRAFYLTDKEARAHELASLLLLNGMELPVSLCDGEVDVSSCHGVSHGRLCVSYQDTSCSDNGHQCMPVATALKQGKPLTDPTGQRHHPRDWGSAP